MGLDMFLTLTENGRRVEVAYWRKANQIHNWFVENVQNGVDDCKSYKVTREQLENLRHTCLKVLGEVELTDGTVKNGERLTSRGWEPILEPGKVVVDSSVAERLLPTAKGFFFGSTDYNQWYVEDLKDTVKQIDSALARAPEEAEFRYQSSW